MRDYEIVYIFRSSLASEAIEEKLERFHAILTGDGEGEITGSAHWGKRQFAYPIRKQKNGYYVVVQFASNPAGLGALERVLKLDDDVLRYLIVIAERPLPAPEEEAEPTDAAAAGEAPDAEDGAETAEAADVEEEAAETDEAAGTEEAAGEEETAADDESAAEAADEPAAEEGDEAAAEETDEPAAAEDDPSDADEDAEDAVEDAEDAGDAPAGGEED